MKTRYISECFLNQAQFELLKYFPMWNILNSSGAHPVSVKAIDGTAVRISGDAIYGSMPPLCACQVAMLHIRGDFICVWTH